MLLSTYKRAELQLCPSYWREEESHIGKSVLKMSLFNDMLHCDKNIFLHSADLNQVQFRYGSVWNQATWNTINLQGNHEVFGRKHMETNFLYFAFKVKLTQFNMPSP